MSPPLAYHNTSWGRAHTFTSSPASPLSPSCPHTRTPHPGLPRRRSESPPQSASASPRRGSISDLPSTRVEGYGRVLRDSHSAGVAPPTRDSVKFYASRALPPTPSSTISSVVETTIVVPPPPTPSSSGVKAYYASKPLPPTPGSAVPSVAELLPASSRGVERLRAGGRKTSITAREVTLQDGSGRISGVEGRICMQDPPRAAVDPDVAFQVYIAGLPSPAPSTRSTVGSSLDPLPPSPMSESDFEPQVQSKSFGQRMKRLLKGLSCSRAE